jgi:hypothetical protein
LIELSVSGAAGPSRLAPKTPVKLTKPQKALPPAACQQRVTDFDLSPPKSGLNPCQSFCSGG